MRRRDFIKATAISVVTWPLAARAQQSKIPKVGFLYPGPSGAAAPRIGAFLEGLRAAGYSAPDQVELSPRVADGDLTMLAPMARELVERNVNVLVAVAASAANVARASTTTIPIVAMDLETDPVTTGMIASLSRPGGNLTGVFFDFPDFRAKLLELLREVVPKLSKVAVLWDPNVGPAQLKEFESAADSLKLTLVKLEVRNVAEMNQAFAAAKQANVDACHTTVVALHRWKYEVGRRLDVEIRAAGSDPFCRVRAKWWANVVWTDPSRHLSSSRRPCCQSASRKLSGRFAGRAANKFRACSESQDRKGYWRYDTNLNSSASRFGDRIATRFAAPAHVRYWHLADMPAALIDVRFRGITRK
jgi:hypothetical protein